LVIWVGLAATLVAITNVVAAFWGAVVGRIKPAPTYGPLH
jgi:hypothetical protein